MKLLGHVAGSYLINRWVTGALKPSSKAERHRLLILGTVAGTIPDWDYSWYAIKKGRLDYSSDFRHHTWITHTFFFYWTLSTLLYTIGIFRKDKLMKKKAAVIAAGTTTHLIQDAIGSGDGIRPFYPFSKRTYGIALSGLHGREWDRHYTQSPIYLNSSA